MRVLISPWGDFRKWKVAKYTFSGKSLESRSTLPIMVDVIRPQETIIIVPDTLSSDFSSQESMWNSVKDEVKEFTNQLGVEDVKIIVVPGSGSFSNGSFFGNPMDAYMFLLYELAKELPLEIKEVHLDVTHGLNYLTFFTVRVVQELLGILSIRKGVVLKTYSSDPFVDGSVRHLRVNLIEEATIDPKPLSEFLEGKFLVNYSMDRVEFGEIARRLKAKELDLGRINSWIASLKHGLPLVFTTMYPQEGEVEGVLEDVVAKFLEGFNVGEGKVVRSISLGKDFGSLAKLYFQLRVLKDLKEMYNLPKDEASVEELLKISEEIFTGRIKHSTKVELDNVANRVEKTEGWVKLSEFFKNANPQVDPRNFFAHAGLEANLVEVKRNGELYLRYTKGKVRWGGKEEKAEKVIREILTSRRWF